MENIKEGPPCMRDMDAQRRQALSRVLGAREASFAQALSDLREALQPDMLYLMENMLLGDLACISGAWLQRHVEDSHYIMEQVSWGKSVPAELFRHFVLPFRINNENIDYQRLDFFSRLWPRVADLSMEEAVLEVNRYCYEQVRYVATDIRTLGPAGLIRRGLGRCGEQSTMLIALLRSIGIPSRQCYISRWSHTESNHAWVEAWTGDGWHYLGACEPEESLDRGWFTEGLKRAILVQTRGGDAQYQLEPVLARKGSYSIINLTARYTTTCQLQIKALHEGRPLAGAEGQFSVFNSGEFFPLHQFVCGEAGLSEGISLGLGSVLIELEGRASKTGEKLAYWGIHQLEEGQHKLNCELKEAKLALPAADYFEFRPAAAQAPLERGSVEACSSEQQAQHLAAMKAGEAAYQAKMRAFQAERCAQELLALFPDLKDAEQDIEELFRSASCNAEEWQKAFEQLYPLYGRDLLALFKLMSLKERSLVSCFDIDDFLSQALRYKEAFAQDKELWLQYILQPQADFEELRAHRRYLRQALEDDLGSCPSPRDIFNWADREIKREEGHSFFYYRSAQPPLRSFQLGRADALSRRVLLVALLRSFGHPARLNSSLLLLEWWEDGCWQRETLDEASSASEKEKQGAQLSLLAWEVLPHSAQISLARKKPKGIGYQSLYCGDAQAEEGLHGETQSLQKLLSSALPAGEYRLCLGLRDEQGNVRGHIQHFSLASGQKREIQLPVLQLEEAWQKTGSLAVGLGPYGRELSLYITTTKIDEPFYHVLNDLSQDELCCKYLELLFPQALETELRSYLQRFPSLQRVHFIEEQQVSSLEAQLAAASEWGQANDPKIALLHNAEGREDLVFSTCGYSRSAISQLSRALDYYQNHIISGQQAQN